jgi:hypothetical protein
VKEKQKLVLIGKLILIYAFPPYANYFWNTAITKVQEYLCQHFNQLDLLAYMQNFVQHLSRMTMVLVVIAAIFTTKGKVEKAAVSM